jgi:hypothetical protein
LNERDSRKGKPMSKKRWLVIVVAAIALAILLDTMLANHRPAITSLEAPERVIPSGSCQIVCTASDRDGDELSYTWSGGGLIKGEGGTVTWTAPSYPLGYYNVTVTVTDGHGGKATKEVTIEVKTSKPPKINSLVADADWTTPSGSIQVTCTAPDPDGDELSYEWAADGGDISGTGAVVNWTAPEAVGVYQVTVVVTDAFGQEDTTLISLSVSLDTPPIIEDLIVTAKEPKYLIKTSIGYTVGQTKEYDIECKVSDTSVGVSYNWSCEDGEISDIFEDGSRITWTAPGTSGKVPVMVIVSDTAGNKVGKSTVFTVADCTSCTFG